MATRVVTLDVREDVRQGREPFSKILETAASLQNRESLLLIVPFEPVPIYRMMARQGFSHKSKPTGTGDWEVLFMRGATSDVFAKSPAPRQSASA
jgi:hypothetical protein